MDTTKPVEETPAVEEKGHDEMAKYGITRVSVDQYHYKQYRYTHLDEAVAQAERELAESSVNGLPRPRLH
ncbi:hypothetical protein [Geminicoccus flavidas]|uniref:hypothetical protein n=1 Tax=Geminicoccus flavidas TaxID=2506407 RepID=UPI00135A9E84|nr:hypothetical protein [Geminicoccus flavidas]